MKSETVLAIDLGGTKIEMAAVHSSGRVLRSLRVPADHSRGKDGLIQLLVSLARDFYAEFPKIKAIGMASAGPLDSKRGFLLDPTNMKTNGRSWGQVNLKKPLESALKKPFFLDNDAAAATLAENWLGGAKNLENYMVLTLGTGLGVGAVCSGKLARAGRGLHPEASHVFINARDRSAPCGCGLFGCAEAYLSGKNFESRYKTPALVMIERADSNDRRALQAFQEYSEILALAIVEYVVLFAPEKIFLSGSFAKGSRFFLRHTRGALAPLLKRRRVGIDLLPRLAISQLGNHACLMGGAYIALRRGDV